MWWGRYAVLIAKLLPPTGVRLLDAVKWDSRLCLLVPLAVPTALAGVYLNWLAFKFFKNN